jgi:hypothetical protein
LFLRSPAHVGVIRALRRAELSGLGAAPDFADAILAARPALDLEHGDFWRTAWQFLIANAATIDRAHIAPIIDFLHGVRHERVEVETAAGVERRDPPSPDFSLDGRTVRSVLTIEVDPARKAIVHVRGLYNRTPIGRSWQIVQAWARRERLRIAC